MKKTQYITPAIEVEDMEAQLLDFASTHDEEGSGTQLGRSNNHSWDSNED